MHRSIRTHSQCQSLRHQAEQLGAYQQFMLGSCALIPFMHALKQASTLSGCSTLWTANSGGHVAVKSTVQAELSHVDSVGVTEMGTTKPGTAEMSQKSRSNQPLFKLNSATFA